MEVIIHDADANTKERIFLTATELFALKGYENISMRTIADTVGIKAASIYNHYEGKEKILDACYEYYLAHRYDTRLTQAQYEPILRNGTREEVMGVLNYSFAEVMKMFFLTLIVFSRVYTDAKAKKIYESEISNALEYMREFFQFGIEIGRFKDFNIGVYAQLCINTRLFTATSATLDPDQQKWRVTEMDVFNELAHTLPFNY